MRAWLSPLVLLLCAACSAPPVPAPDAGSDAIKGVRAVVTAQIDAWNRGDLDGYMAGYWKSPDLVFFFERHGDARLGHPRPVSRAPSGRGEGDGHAGLRVAGDPAARDRSCHGAGAVAFEDAPTEKSRVG